MAAELGGEHRSTLAGRQVAETRLLAVHVAITPTRGRCEDGRRAGCQTMIE